MLSLSDMQRDFANALLNADAAVPGGVKSHLRARPQKRFAVYRNNVYASLIDVLQGTFPVVARLVGHEFFRATARVFVEQQPPTTAVLMRYGAGLAAFLDQFKPVADLPYLGDVARLEWGWNEAYHAADRLPLTTEQLQAVPATDAASLCFELHPSVRLVRSAFPVVTVWRANRREEWPGRIDASAGGEDALIARPQLSVEVRRLPPGGADFLQALLEGQALAEAAAAGGTAADDFDLQANLIGLVRSGGIAAVHRQAQATKGRDEG